LQDENEQAKVRLWVAYWKQIKRTSDDPDLYGWHFKNVPHRKRTVLRNIKDDEERKRKKDFWNFWKNLEWFKQKYLKWEAYQTNE